MRPKRKRVMARFSSMVLVFPVQREEERPSPLLDLPDLPSLTAGGGLSIYNRIGEFNRMKFIDGSRFL
jgi:hypothetical protein